MTSVLKSALRSPKVGTKVTRSKEDLAASVLSALEMHCSGQGSTSYDQLVQQVVKMELQEVQLKDMLALCRENLHYLDVRCEALVLAILRLDWCMMNAPTVREYSALLLSLVSAHTRYLNTVLLMLIKNLLPRSREVGTSVPRPSADQTQAEEAQYARTHAVLRGICHLVPMAPSLVVPMVSKCFPYMRHPVHIQECYVSNLLELICYMPNQRQDVLEIIIDRLTKLDVYSPKHEIMEAEETKRESENSAVPPTVFQMDVDDNESQLKIESSEPQRMEHGLANTLDTLMTLMIKFIKNMCYSQELGGNFDGEAAKNLFQELWTIFEKLVLPTHDCSHVQFILFYLCSFKISISESFLDALWKNVQNPNTASIIRQASVAYIGSFLARAVVVPISVIATSLEVMCHWIHRYISSQAECARSYVDITLHGPFYSVCQTVFYVFAFRHQELVEMKKGFELLRRLGFDRIVTCRLNPLKVCLPVVVRNFASVARNYQLAYCYTVIEKNQRTILPVVPYRANGSERLQVTALNPLDSFFPFDPYLLIRSSEFITPLYRAYHGLVGEDSPPPEVDEDDFLGNDEPTSPSADHVSSLTEFLSYSLSPGFKHAFPT